MLKFISTGLVALFASLSWSGTVIAQASTNRVAESADWSVFVENNPKECWAVSAPKEVRNTRDGNPVPFSRGDILLFLFFRPTEGVIGQLAFTSGYTFGRNSMVNLNVDGTTYILGTEGEWAWPLKSGDEATIVAAMKKGARATFVSQSTTGIVTTDIFSLSGFTASVNEAAKQCEVALPKP